VVGHSITNAQGASDTASITDGQLAHVAGVYDGATNAITLYVNGAVAALSVNAVGAGALLDDAAVAASIGNETTTSTRAFSGLIDDAKVFRSALSASEVLEHHLCGLYRQRIPVPQPWSALPDLDLHGEVTACEQLLVNGSTGKEKTIQHGGTSGWLNNNREIPFVLDVK